MSAEIIEIFTWKSTETILKNGGSSAWLLDRGHAKRAGYAVLYRNAHSKSGDGREPHGTAFLVGRIADVVPAPKREGRWIVQFDEFARIDVPKAWAGHRNPIHYTSAEELLKQSGIDVSNLTFEPMPAPSTMIGGEGEEIEEPSPSAGLTIAEAKKGLAITFGVSPDAVEITIRG